MIDASRSPRSVWRRVTTVFLVAAMIVFLAWAIWVKELHHRSPQIRTVSALHPAVLVTPGHFGG